jgi:hypothetical protein
VDLRMTEKRLMILASGIAFVTAVLLLTWILRTLPRDLAAVVGLCVIEGCGFAITAFSVGPHLVRSVNVDDVARADHLTGWLPKVQPFLGSLRTGTVLLSGIWIGYVASSVIPLCAAYSVLQCAMMLCVRGFDAPRLALDALLILCSSIATRTFL